jgi:chromosome segregation protein
MMFLFKRAHLVQFFLFDAITFEFDATTAIIAPNGAGKSAILDALQIVMLGADGNQLRFNAQAGGTHRARTIRDYCLGVFREGDEGRARKTATTFLSLIFKDEETDELLTAGIALGASVDEPEHRIYGWYLLPGVALSLDDHLETLQGAQVPLTWASFKAQATQLCKQAGAVPTLPTSPERFVDDLLKRLRPRTSYIDPVAFRKAFRNALNLQKVDDVDLFVRTSIAEDRPTDIAKFRQLLDGFRQIKETIERVIERIQAGELVEQAYKAVARAAVRAASYRALSATYVVELQGEQEDAAERELDAAIDEHEARKRQIVELGSARSSARDDLEAASNRLHETPGYADQSALDTARRQGEQAVAFTATQLGREVRQARDAMQAVAELDLAGVDATKLAATIAPWNALYDDLAQRAPDAGLKGSPERIREALFTALKDQEPARAALTATLQTLRNQHAEAQQHERTARNNQGRASTGKAELHSDVSRLRDYLSDAGIEATPVCDLVRIADAEWQPAIEAYLRSNVEALLIRPDQEEDAVRLYRGLRGPQAIYGVKLALSSHARRAANAALGRDSVAMLIEGDNADAVAYLRMQLGELKQVQSEREAVLSKRGLTRDGLLTKGGSIERLRLPGGDELKIGMAQSRERRQRLEAVVQRLAGDTLRLKRELEKFDQQGIAFMALRQSEQVVDRIHGLLLALHESIATLRRQRVNQLAGASPDLLLFAEQRDACKQLLDEIEAQLDKANRALGAAETGQQNAEKNLATVQARAVIIRDAESEAVRHPDVDPQALDEARQELDQTHARIEERINVCEKRSKDAAVKLGKTLPEAWVGLTTYAANFSLRLELVPDQWREASRLIGSDLQRLRETELIEHQARADEAYAIAINTFRNNVASTLYDNFTRLKQQISSLNSTLKRSPAFSNNERYQFRQEIVPELKELHQFIQQVGDHGSADSLFGSAGEVPAVFRDIIESNSTLKGRGTPSPLDDYRLFYHFEVLIKQDEQVIGSLSKRMKSGSGGEHRAPLYVIAGASLAAAYGKRANDISGLGVILLDEFGDKIDAQNARAVTDYLRSLGLQLILAAPDTAQGSLTGVLDSYIDLFRDNLFLQINRVEVRAAGRELLESDQFLLHPELLDAEVARISTKMRDDAKAAAETKKG